MQNFEVRHKGPRPPGQAGVPGRRLLEPTDPLPGWKAVVQVLILLGVPVTLLLLARLILRTYFPHLGY